MINLEVIEKGVGALGGQGAEGAAQLRGHRGPRTGRENIAAPRISESGNSTNKY